MMDVENGGDVEPKGDFEDWNELHSLQRKKLDYTWQDLKVIENRRREILLRVDKPFWRILRYWEGTCLRVLSRDFLVWGCLLIYAVIRMQAHMNHLPGYIRALGNANVDVVGGFLSFFLVLFCNQSNARFFEQYKCSMECTRRLYDLSTLATTGLPLPNALRMVRFMNAAHCAGYIGLSDTYTKQNLFDALNPSYKMLTKQELARIEALDMNDGSEAFRELTTWVLKEIVKAQNDGLIEGRFAGEMRDKVLNFRAAMESVYDYHDQPIHVRIASYYCRLDKSKKRSAYSRTLTLTILQFYYIHFLSLLTAIYLPVFAISTAYSAGVGDEVHWSSDVLSGLVVLVQSIFVVGLRLLGQRLLDPYGSDLEDLSVLHYIQDGWRSSQRVLSTEFPAVLDPEKEIDLASSSASIGLPWDATLRKRSRQATPSFA